MFDETTTFPLQCDVCGRDLTRAEESDPCVFKVYYDDAFGVQRYHNRTMCDLCASDYILYVGKRPVSEMTAQLRREHEAGCYAAMSATYPFRKVRHI